MEEKEPAKVQTYTSLEEEQVHTIMRSVSMEDSDTLESRKQAMSDSQDLFVKVDSPEKHIEGYVSYSVTTQVRFYLYIFLILYEAANTLTSKTFLML